MGKPGCPIPPPAGGSGRATPVRRGMGQPGCPTPPPAGGFGRATPASRGRGKPGFPSPPSQPPPAGGRRRDHAPDGGGSARGRSPCPRSRAAGGTPALPGRVHRVWRAPRMGPDVNMGEPGSPIPPPAGEPGSHAAVGGNRVAPRPPPPEGSARAPLARGCGPEARAPGARAYRPPVVGASVRLRGPAPQPTGGAPARSVGRGRRARGRRARSPVAR